MLNLSNVKKVLIAFIILHFNSNVDAQNAINNSGNMQMHAGSQMAFFCDLINEGTFNNNLGTALFSGSVPQSISGTNNIKFKDIILNNPSEVKLDQELQVSGVLTFSAGKILSDKADIATEYVNFLDGATHIGSNGNRFIDGVVRKTGNDAFVFPLGDGSKWARIGISTPSLITDAFTATYYNTGYVNTTTMALAPSPVLYNVSNNQYWVCERSSGVSNININLFWENSTQNGIDNFTSDLVVAHWNGTSWENAGQSGVNSGTNGDVSSEIVNSFSPFTFGSLSASINPLPMELLSFETKVIDNNKVKLDWQTSTEINNDYFIVERSQNTFSWEEVTQVKGAGNSSSMLFYSSIDDSPFNGTSYYRIKQVDFNGHYSFSSIRTVNFDRLENLSGNIYPNPTQNQITIACETSELEGLKIYNVLGTDVSSSTEVLKSNEAGVVVGLTNLPRGVYTVVTKTNVYKVLKQ
jgi:hypothetical protein